MLWSSLTEASLKVGFEVLPWDVDTDEVPEVEVPGRLVVVLPKPV